MRPVDATIVLAVVVVAVAAILGGAFYPGPRMAVGLSFAVTLAVAVYWRRDRLQADEWAWIVFLGWGVAAGVGAWTAPLISRVAGAGLADSLPSRVLPPKVGTFQSPASSACWTSM